MQTSYKKVVLKKKHSQYAPVKVLTWKMDNLLVKAKALRAFTTNPNDEVQKEKVDPNWQV